MSLEADAIAARRSLRRKLTFWRVAAFGVFALAVLAAGLIAGGKETATAAFSDHVARIRVDGLITGDGKTLDLIRKLRDEPRVKAVILRIDSPGGTTVGSEALYHDLLKLGAKKPLVAVMDSVAASGGYIAALPASYVVARGNTITGSIGVIFSWPDVSKLLDTLGIKMEELKSGDLKAEPAPYHPISPKAREVTEAMVADSFDWFVGLVATNRKMPREQVLALADGRVFTGRQALKAGLIDAIGGEDQARAWLKVSRGIPESMQRVDYKPASDDPWAKGLGTAIIRHALNLAGLGDFATQLEKALVPERLSLDGLQSVWHPSQLSE